MRWWDKNVVKKKKNFQFTEKPRMIGIGRESVMDERTSGRRRDKHEMPIPKNDRLRQYEGIVYEIDGTLYLRA